MGGQVRVVPSFWLLRKGCVDWFSLSPKLHNMWNVKEGKERKNNPSLQSFTKEHEIDWILQKKKKRERARKSIPTSFERWWGASARSQFEVFVKGREGIVDSKCVSCKFVIFFKIKLVLILQTHKDNTRNCAANAAHPFSEIPHHKTHTTTISTRGYLQFDLFVQNISNVREIEKCDAHGARSLSGALGETKSRSGLSHSVGRVRSKKKKKKQKKKQKKTRKTKPMQKSEI